MSAGEARAATAPAPDVTVVISAAGAGTHIHAQIEALTRQDPGCRWELVVVDNGLTADARAHVDALLGVVPDARVVTARDIKGPSYGRNAGAESARAPLVLFCDDDDVVADGWIAAMRSALAGADLVGGSLRIDRINSAQALAWRVPPSGGGLPDMHQHLPYALSSNMGVRRDVFLAVGGFDTALYPGEDVDLSWRVQYAGGIVAFAPGAVVDYRYRDDVRTYLRQQRAYGRVSGEVLVKHRDRGAVGINRWVDAARLVVGVRNLARGRDRRVMWMGAVAYVGAESHVRAAAWWRACRGRGA